MQKDTNVWGDIVIVEELTKEKADNVIVTETSSYNHNWLWFCVKFPITKQFEKKLWWSR